tara:strand:- start:71 stop:436 length:366 start_codon:yes stop_codon:yes gene_type:complete
MVDSINPHIKTNLKIGIERWERFEVLADKNTVLWEIFWGIAKDKEKIKERELCAIVYFYRFILPALDEVFTKLLSKEQANKDDIEIILSLYLKLIPKEICEDCDCIEKIEKNSVFDYAHTI